MTNEKEEQERKEIRKTYLQKKMEKFYEKLAALFIKLITDI